MTTLVYDLAQKLYLCIQKVDLSTPCLVEKANLALFLLLTGSQLCMLYSEFSIPQTDFYALLRVSDRSMIS